MVGDLGLGFLLKLWEFVFGIVDDETAATPREFAKARASELATPRRCGILHFYHYKDRHSLDCHPYDASYMFTIFKIRASSFCHNCSSGTPRRHNTVTHSQQGGAK